MVLANPEYKKRQECSGTTKEEWDKIKNSTCLCNKYQINLRETEKKCDSNLLLTGKLFYYRSNSLKLSRWRPLSYRNQSIDLRGKSMDWFLYDTGLRLERVKDPV